MEAAQNEENNLQLEVTREMIEDSLERAVRSMERMLKIRVQADLKGFGDGPIDYIPEYDSQAKEKFHLVKVIFDGDIEGAFYFIVDGNEVDLINRVCLPEIFKSETGITDETMSHGFMSEIENVIASLTLKVISEYMGVEVLGQVPIIQIVEGQDLNQFLRKENKSMNTAFHVKSVLRGVVVSISPYFIWMLDQKFIEKLRLSL